MCHQKLVCLPVSWSLFMLVYVLVIIVDTCMGSNFLDCKFMGEPSDDVYHEIYEDFVGRMGALCDI